jgi:hypothetical protein
MTGAALAVSILAVIVSAIALWFLFPAETRERKRARREIDAESRALEAERREKLADERAQAADGFCATSGKTTTATRSASQVSRYPTRDQGES